MSNKQRIRKAGQVSSFGYDKLEPRQLLAATLYVDFGVGFGDQLTISDTESRNLGGPEIFGDSFDVLSFAEFLGESFHTFAATTFQVEQLLDSAFAPFDVDVEIVESQSLDEIQTVLESTATNDAYVFVGDSASEVFSDFGEALVDVGNTQDNLAFVFARDTGEHNFYFADTIATSIAKQAAHTFGLESIEYGRNVFGSGEPDSRGFSSVMAQIGTDANGDEFRQALYYSDRSTFFHRTELPLTLENGVSAGVQNSYEILVGNVGANVDYATYLSGFSSNQNVELISRGENVVDVTIDDVEWLNVDVSNGLELWLSQDYGSSSGVIVIDHAITADVHVETVPFGLESVYRGYKKRFSASTVQMLGAPVDAIHNSDRSMDLNGNFHVDLVGSVRSGDFDDKFTVGSADVSISSGGGNDEVIANSSYSLNHVDLGDGDDIILASSALSFGSLIAGEGHDVLDYSQVNGFGPELHLKIENGRTSMFLLEQECSFSMFGDICFDVERPMAGFENIIASERTNGSIVRDATPEHVDWEFDGRFLNYSTETFTNEVVFENFSGLSQRLSNFNFSDSSVRNEFYQDVYVKATAYPLMIANASLVQIGSDTDVSLSNTESINHDIKIWSQNTVQHQSNSYVPHEKTEVVISNIAGELTPPTFISRQGLETVVGGITNANVIVNYRPYVGFGSVNYLLQIHGSASNNNVALITGTNVETELFGSSGNDLFYVGSTDTTARGNLDLIKGNIKVHGGEGYDQLYIDDNLYGSGRNYTFNNWFAVVDDEGNNHAGIQINSGLERIELNATEFSDDFTVAPYTSADIVIVANGGTNSLSFVHPNPGSGFRQAVPGGVMWTFAGLNPVTLLDSEIYSSETSLFATATVEGTPTSVVIRDASDNRIYREFQLFGTAYTGGVNVAMADITGDGVDDLLVAARKGLAPVVWAYDTVSGLFVTKFEAYGSQYLGGIHIATGNVTGDSRPEIVVSKMEGVPLVRVYSQVANGTNFRSTSFHRPYDFSYRQGAAIAIADMNDDGFDDVIAGATNGEQTQVAIHAVNNNDLSGSQAVSLNRFLVFDQNYGSAITVGAFHSDRSTNPGLVVGAGNSSSVPGLNGSIHFYENDALAGSDGDTVLASSREILAFADSAKQVDFTVRDLNGDGLADRLVASTAESRIVNIFDASQYGDWYGTDAFFASNPNFAEGISVG